MQTSKKSVLIQREPRVIAALFRVVRTRPVFVVLFVLLASVLTGGRPMRAQARKAVPAPPPYRLELEVDATAPFPFLSKFGSVDVTVFPKGVRGDSLILDGIFARGSKTVTVLSPLSRMYTEMQLSEVGSAVLALSGRRHEVMPGLGPFPISRQVVRGAVKGVPANRYRVILGPNASVDVWTTAVIPRSPQFEFLQNAFIGAISKSLLQTSRAIPGTPIYVELNTRRFRKLTLVKLKSLSRTIEGQDDALEVGSFYIRAPFLDSLWKK